MFNFKS